MSLLYTHTHIHTHTHTHTLFSPTDFKQDLDQWCAKTHAAVEAAVYERTVKSSEAIDKKLAELVEALGRISESPHEQHCHVTSTALSSREGGVRDGPVQAKTGSILC